MIIYSIYPIIYGYTKKGMPMPEGTEITVKKNRRGLHLNGRPKGVKNKTTIFREAMREGFEEKLQKDFKKVLDAVVHCAVNGDMTAAKLLMDRVIPVQKSIDLEDIEKGKGLTISINVGSLEKNGNLPVEAEYTEVND